MAGSSPIKVTHVQPSNDTDLRTTQEESLSPRFTSFLSREFESRSRPMEAQVTTSDHSSLPIVEDED